ncbi:MAG: hypothetical protein KIT02_10215 [Devosia sp.]|uniref:hypothetical protein n=1 Tax=Devosia sp. TaxID=1871048 RepID=UPI0024CB6790|nr:hypothetical protein [Devosia sp.]UYN98340.1 MAG: hypothetical protein KIT02_10215 [Devosia sp.]
MSMTPSRRRIEAYRLKHAAEEGRVIIYTCRACRNETAFLATDVVDIWGPDMMVYEPPSRCGRCKCSGYMSVRFHIPTRFDIGALRLRRPNGVRRLWKWDVYRG